SLPDGSVGRSYSTTVGQSGGTSPYIWSIGTGSLPAGLSLNTGSGQISGTPTAAEVADFTIQVVDSAGASSSRPLTVRITLPLQITTTVLPDGTIANGYSQTLIATGGAVPYSNWKVIAGALPAGLSLNPNTGEISGGPTATGTATFTVQVNDSG